MDKSKRKPKIRDEYTSSEEIFLFSSPSSGENGSTSSEDTFDFSSESSCSLTGDSVSSVDENSSVTDEIFFSSDENSISSSEEESFSSLENSDEEDIVSFSEEDEVFSDKGDTSSSNEEDETSSDEVEKPHRTELTWNSPTKCRKRKRKETNSEPEKKETKRKKQKVMKEDDKDNLVLKFGQKNLRISKRQNETLELNSETETDEPYIVQIPQVLQEPKKTQDCDDDLFSHDSFEEWNRTKHKEGDERILSTNKTYGLRFIDQKNLSSLLTGVQVKTNGKGVFNVSYTNTKDGQQTTRYLPSIIHHEFEKKHKIVYGGLMVDILKISNNQIPTNFILIKILGKMCFDEIPKDIPYKQLWDDVILFKKFLFVSPKLIFETEETIMIGFKKWCILKGVLNNYNSFIQVVNKYNNKKFS